MGSMERSHKPSTDIQVSERRWNSKRILLALVCLQFLAVPGLVLQNFVPPVLGIGSFSVAVDIRYVRAFMWGASLSLLVLLPFLFAWSPRYFLRRATLFLPLTYAWAAANILIIFLYMANVSGVSLVQAVVQEFSALMGLVWLATCFLAGFVVVPMAIRAHRGWLVADSCVEQVISRSERRIECVGLAVIAILILFSGSVETEATGMGMLFSIFGIVAGGALSASAFWLLRDLSPSKVRILFATHALVLIGVPGVVLLGIMARLFMQLVGSEFYCIGFLTAAAILLLQVICLRMSGYRIRKMEFEKAIPAKVGKAVVDPFSD